MTLGRVGYNGILMNNLGADLGAKMKTEIYKNLTWEMITVVINVFVYLNSCISLSAL